MNEFEILLIHTIEDFHYTILLSNDTEPQKYIKSEVKVKSHTVL